MCRYGVWCSCTLLHYGCHQHIVIPAIAGQDLSKAVPFLNPPARKTASIAIVCKPLLIEVLVPSLIALSRDARSMGCSDSRFLKEYLCSSVGWVWGL